MVVVDEQRLVFMVPELVLESRMDVAPGSVALQQGLALAFSCQGLHLRRQMLEVTFLFVSIGFGQPDCEIVLTSVAPLHSHHFPASSSNGGMMIAQHVL